MTAWFPLIAALIGLAGTALGWTLNQLGQWFLYRRERQRAIARAVHGMLEIRDRVRTLPEAVRALSQRLGLQAADQVVLTVVLEGFVFEQKDGFAEQFETSIGILAEHDPVLAFRMRNKNLLIPLLKRLRQLTVADRTLATFWLTFEQQIMNEGLPRFDEGLLELAKLHSRRVLKDVQASLRSKIELPEPLMSTLLAAMQENLRRQAEQAAQLQRQAPRQRVPVWASASNAIPCPNPANDRPD